MIVLHNKNIGGITCESNDSQIMLRCVKTHEFRKTGGTLRYKMEKKARTLQTNGIYHGICFSIFNIHALSCLDVERI